MRRGPADGSSFCHSRAAPTTVHTRCNTTRYRRHHPVTQISAIPTILVRTALSGMEYLCTESKLRDCYRETMTPLPTCFAVATAGDCYQVFAATKRRERGDDWLAPSACTYRIAFQHVLTPYQPPAPVASPTFTPVSLVMVRPCGQYHGEIVHDTAWRQVGIIGDIPILEFTPNPPWPCTPKS